MEFNEPITIALAKGRIFKQTLPLLAQAGLELRDDPEVSRKLLLDTNHDNVKILIIRATDVPTYVQWGAADLGVSGKDTLIEHGEDGLYEPLDLKIARCRLMVAGPEGFKPGPGRLRVATKYVKSARDYFARKGQQVEIIKLYGAMELAPLVGLADVIVDLVESGNTLKANKLVPMEHITDISSRLVVNRVAWKTKHKTMKALMEILREAVAKEA